MTHSPGCWWTAWSEGESEALWPLLWGWKPWPEEAHSGARNSPKTPPAHHRNPKTHRNTDLRTRHRHLRWELWEPVWFWQKPSHLFNICRHCVHLCLVSVLSVTYINWEPAKVSSSRTLNAYLPIAVDPACLCTPLVKHQFTSTNVCKCKKQNPNVFVLHCVFSPAQLHKDNIPHSYIQSTASPAPHMHELERSISVMRSDQSSYITVKTAAR